MGIQSTLLLIQNHLLLPALLLATGVLGSASVQAEPLSPPQQVVVHIDGMTCAGCQTTVKNTLEHLDFVDSANASFAAGGACLQLSGTGSSERIQQAITDNTAYVITSIEAVDVCPKNLQKGKQADAWDGVEGLDVQIISRGETVDLKSHLVDNKFTIIDFGAPWCGPCHTAAKELQVYLAAHNDVAVRVVTLDAETSEGSYALPVVEQHLKWASGIPYFLVYDSAGKRIYKGERTDKLMNSIDKKRAKK